MIEESALLQSARDENSKDYTVKASRIKHEERHQRNFRRRALIVDKAPRTAQRLYESRVYNAFILLRLRLLVRAPLYCRARLYINFNFSMRQKAGRLNALL